MGECDVFSWTRIQLSYKSWSQVASTQLSSYTCSAPRVLALQSAMRHRVMSIPVVLNLVCSMLACSSESSKVAKDDAQGDRFHGAAPASLRRCSATLLSFDGSQCAMSRAST